MITGYSYQRKYVPSLARYRLQQFEDEYFFLLNTTIKLIEAEK